MKFKYLIIVFSIIIVIIILIAALLPLFLAGPEVAVNIRYITVPFLLFMVALLVSLGVFFFFNYRLLSLLEREDWPALAYYLEQEIFVKGRYSARNVRILASSFLVISDYPSVQKLESKTLVAKPSVVDKNVLIFGAAKILNGSHSEAAAFFKTHLEKSDAKDKQWVRWFLGFSQLLSGAFSQAEPEFSSLALSSDDAIITTLSAYFLDSSVRKHSLKPDECRIVAENGRKRVVAVLKNAVNWKKEVERVENNIHIAIIMKYINEAEKWLFG